MQQIIWIRYQNEWNQLGIHESHSQLIKGSEARLPNLAVRRTWFQGVQYQLGLSVIGIHGRKPSLLHAKSSKIPFVFDMWLTLCMRLHSTFNFVERHEFFLSVSLFGLKERKMLSHVLTQLEKLRIKTQRNLLILLLQMVARKNESRSEEAIIFSRNIHKIFLPKIFS